MEKTTYILQKDIQQPNDHNYKAGEKFTKENECTYVSSDGKRVFYFTTVENNPELFKKEEPNDCAFNVDAINKRIAELDGNVDWKGIANQVREYCGSDWEEKSSEYIKGQFHVLLNVFKQSFKKETEQTSEQFVWTDELVKEYARSFGYAGEPDIEEFKKENSKVKKEEPKKQWEILSYQYMGYVYKKNSFGEFVVAGVDFKDVPIQYLILHPENMKCIRSVKRLSDGEVFSIGDKVITIHGVVTIQKFEYKKAYMDDSIWMYYEGGCMTSHNEMGEMKNIHKYHSHSPINAKQESPLPIKVTQLLPMERQFGRSSPFVDYCLQTSSAIPEEKYEPIREAIEAVLNNKPVMIELNMQVTQSPRKYTSDELLEAQQKAFDAAREIDFNNEKWMKHKTFSDYIQSLNK